MRGTGGGEAFGSRRLRRKQRSASPEEGSARATTMTSAAAQHGLAGCAATTRHARATAARARKGTVRCHNCSSVSHRRSLRSSQVMTWAAAVGEEVRSEWVVPRHNSGRVAEGGSQRSLATNTAARRHGIELPGARRNSSTARACRGSAGIKRGGSGCHLDAGGVERERARRRDSQVARR